MNDAGEVTIPTGEWIDKVKANDPDEFKKMEDVYNLCKEKGRYIISLLKCL